VLKNRTETWAALIVLAVGLLLAAILGLWGYMSATATPLHPSPQDVPSMTHSVPLRQWADAVDQGRQIVRAGLTEQNLPGLSVAVGVGGDIVWAEGSGWANVENQVPVAPGTRFRAADASKALTSAAVGLLLEKNKLHLDDQIQVHVPEFPKKPWPVTLRQLMAQVGGVTKALRPTMVARRNCRPMSSVTKGGWLGAASERSTGCSWITSRSVSCCSSRALSTALRATAGSS
jgi:CubicO group peptidase (beta-lactamase class C family)